MAISKIQYDDKVAINIDSTIPDINKCNASDLNEIKSVVNNNADEIPSNDNLVNVGTSVDTDYRVNVLYSKNLFDGQLELGNYGANGEKIVSTTTYGNKNIVPVKPNTTYTLSINGISQKYVLYYYDNSRTFISSTTSLTTGTFTTPNNCYYINFRCFANDFTSDFANLKVQLEEGSEATTYEPYITPSINVDGEEIYSKETKYDVINVNTAFSSSSQTISIPSIDKYEYLVCHIRNSYNRLFSIIIDKFVLKELASANYNVISLPTKVVSNNNLESLATGRISYASGGTINYIYDISNGTFPLTFDRIVCYYK